MTGTTMAQAWARTRLALGLALGLVTAATVLAPAPGGRITTNGVVPVGTGPHSGRYDTAGGGTTGRVVAPGAWRRQHSGVTELSSVACLNTRTCYAAGTSGAVGTTDGGRTWRSVPGVGGDSIACPGAHTCYIVGPYDDAVGSDEVIMVTRNGGVTWHRERNPLAVSEGPEDVLNGITCPGVRTCYVVGGQTGRSAADGVILVTVDGGATWHVRWSQSQSADEASRELASVSCASLQACYVTYARALGAILASSDGGTTWRDRQIGSLNVTSLSCPGVATCYALGNGFAVTTNEGRTWRVRQASMTGMTGSKDESLQPEVLACPVVTTCYAVGTRGLIVATADGGITWRRQTTPLQQDSRDLLAQLAHVLVGVACPRVTTCYAVGNNGLILARS